MAVGKEIRGKIRSIRSTQKITRAMEMVAASKMRKAQERRQTSRPYAEKIRQVIQHLAYAHPEHRPAAMQERPVQRVAYIVVTSDRGLCGGLNTNLLKTLISSMRAWSDQGVTVEAGAIGQKGLQFLRRIGVNLLATVTHIGDAPKVESLIGAVKVVLDAFAAGKLDRVFLVHNQFVNTMTQRPLVLPLLPVQADAPTQAELGHYWDYLYEPGAEEVLDALLTRYIESMVYQAVVENLACEQAARMVAMKAASDNAGKLIGELQLVYNKARQAAITQEIAEIVGGAAAV